MQNKLLLKTLFEVFGIGFGLNLVWENLQAPLYAGFTNFSHHFWMCFVASIGDAFAIATFYFIIAALRKDILWFKKNKMANFALTAGFGAVTAFGIEYFALASGKWYYLSSMPLLPFTSIGLMPFLQLLVLTPVTFYLTNLILESK